jgi:hypothetical protein
MSTSSGPSDRPARALRHAGVAAALSCVLGGCGGAKTDPCRESFVSDLAAVETVPAHQRGSVMAAALADLCNAPSHPMPKGLGDALYRYGQMGGHGGIELIGTGVADLMLTDPDLWSSACGKPVAEIARGMQTLAARGGEGFLEICPVGALGFARPAELANVPPAPLMLAGLTQAWLVREGVRTSHARRAARALTGL